MKIIEWKPIKGFDGYFINELGEVKSTRTYKGTKEKILKSHKNQQGYLVYTLMRFGKPCLKPLHRLLMETFKPNKEKLPCINHIDENKLNASKDNLMFINASLHQSKHNKGKTISDYQKEKIRMSNYLRKGIKKHIKNKRTTLLNRDELGGFVKTENIYENEVD